MWGVIDIGSNTIRMVAYDFVRGEVRPLLNKKYAAGLVSYVDKDNILNDDGIRLLVEILRRFKLIASRIKIVELFPFATASLRNISNTEEVLETIRRECGLSVDVLSGHEEAILDYYGAIRSVHLEEGMLVDVGGGSTELVFYRKGQAIMAESIPVGSLNLFQQYVSDILPKYKEIWRIRRDVTKKLRQINLNERLSLDVVCGVGGTARATQVLMNNLKGLPRETNNYSCTRLKDISMMLKEDSFGLSRRILRVAPERIHTLLPGVTILQAVTEFYGSKQMITSQYGVREGYIYNLLEERGVCPC